MPAFTSPAIMARLSPSRLLQAQYTRALPSTRLAGATLTLSQAAVRNSSMSSIVRGVRRSFRDPDGRRPPGRNPAVAAHVSERRRAREAAGPVEYKILRGKKDITEPAIPKAKTRRARFFDPEDDYGKKSIVYQAKTGALEAEVDALRRELKPNDNEHAERAPRESRGGGGEDWGQRGESGNKFERRGTGEGRGGFDRKPGGFDRSGGSDRSGGFDRKPGGFDRSGGFDRKPGGFDRSGGFDRKPGGFDRGGGFDRKPGGFDRKPDVRPRRFDNDRTRDFSSRDARPRERTQPDRSSWDTPAPWMSRGGRDTRERREALANTNDIVSSQEAREYRGNRFSQDGREGGGDRNRFGRDAQEDRGNRFSRDDREDRGDRNRFSRDDRGDRGDRDNRFSRDDRGDRNRFSRDDRGAREDRPSRPSWGERDNEAAQNNSDAPFSMPYTTAASNFLYGRSVVEAALRSSRRKLYTLYLYGGSSRDSDTQSRIRNLEPRGEQPTEALERLAKRLGVKVKIVDERWQRLLDKMSKGRPHNGVVLEASPLPQPPLVALQKYNETVGFPRGFSIRLDHQSREDAEINGEATFVPVHTPALPDAEPVEEQTAVPEQEAADEETVAETAETPAGEEAVEAVTIEAGSEETPTETGGEPSTGSAEEGTAEETAAIETAVETAETAVETAETADETAAETTAETAEAVVETEAAVETAEAAVETAETTTETDTETAETAAETAEAAETATEITAESAAETADTATKTIAETTTETDTETAETAVETAETATETTAETAETVETATETDTAITTITDANAITRPSARTTTPPRFYRPLVLLLEQVLDPGNLGAILRSASFLGVSAVVVSKHGSATLSSVALKASAGASEELPLFSVDKPADFLTLSRKAGWRVYSTVPKPTFVSDSSRKSYDLDGLEQADPLRKQPCILVIGSEGEGLSRAIRRKADAEVTIPNQSGSNTVDSLNVSVAAGLVCASFLRGATRASNEAQRENAKNPAVQFDGEGADVRPNVKDELDIWT